MNLYHDGVFQAAFDSARVYERLVNWKRLPLNGTLMVQCSLSLPSIPERDCGEGCLCKVLRTVVSHHAPGNFHLPLGADEALHLGRCGHCKSMGVIL